MKILYIFPPSNCFIKLSVTNFKVKPSKFIGVPLEYICYKLIITNKRQNGKDFKRES